LLLLLGTMFRLTSGAFVHDPVLKDEEVLTEEKVFVLVLVRVEVETLRLVDENVEVPVIVALVDAVDPVMVEVEMYGFVLVEVLVP
jgi:hypothetical protein